MIVGITLAKHGVAPSGLVVTVLAIGPKVHWSVPQKENEFSAMCCTKIYKLVQNSYAQNKMGELYVDPCFIFEDCLVLC